ncbi:hypothetical protein, partial [Geomonas limicola]|uniref:hypothetical protein n=1 Tax=Geomonas limicola TaxID=2740186 RepID=UPI001AD8F2DC
EFKILGKIFSEEKQKLPPSLTSGIVGVFVSLQGHRFNTLSKGVGPGDGLFFFALIYTQFPARKNFRFF